MSHLYNRSGVPAYGMDPERAASPEADDLKARRAGAPAARNSASRSTSYLIVLMAGIILVLGFTAYGRQRPPPATLIATPCDCPKDGASGGAGPFGAGAGAAVAERAGGLGELGNFHGAGGIAERKLAMRDEPLLRHQRGLKTKKPSERRAIVAGGAYGGGSGGETDADVGAAAAASAAAALEPAKATPTPPRPTFVPRPLQPNPPKSILITGAAGFIGSHFALLLLDRGGYKITAIDDMSRASWDTVLRLQELAKAAKDSDFKFVKQVRVGRVGARRLARAPRTQPAAQAAAGWLGGCLPCPVLPRQPLPALALPPRALPPSHAARRPAHPAPALPRPRPTSAPACAPLPRAEPGRARGDVAAAQGAWRRGNCALRGQRLRRRVDEVAGQVLPEHHGRHAAAAAGDGPRGRELAHLLLLVRHLWRTRRVPDYRGDAAAAHFSVRPEQAARRAVHPRARTAAAAARRGPCARAVRQARQAGRDGS